METLLSAATFSSGGKYGCGGSIVLFDSTVHYNLIQTQPGGIGGLLKVTACIAALLLTSTMAMADDHYVDFDKGADFSKVMTFTIRPGKIDSGRQELNNSIVLKKITESRAPR